MSKRRSKSMRTRNKILAIAAAFVAAFIVYTLIVYTINGWQWDALFEYVLVAGGIVCGFTAVIAIADKIAGRKAGKDNQNDSDS